MDQDTLPYNPLNVLLQERDVVKLLDNGTEIHDINLYRKAMVHRSYCTRKNENFVNGNTQCPEGCLPLQEESNERLEFLGDAVLNLIVAGYLYERYPDENEGFLTKLRTKLVNGRMLGHLCGTLGLQKFVIISKQIEDAGGRLNYKILEDTFEAFLGAIYIDHGENGFNVARCWLVNFLESNIDFSDLVVNNNNHKDSLLKYFQHTYSTQPRFIELSVEGSHQGGKVYTICVKDKNDVVIGTGRGGTKKIAENEASRSALMYYGQSVA